jgi:predicted nucleic acid-binding protein
VTDLLFVDTSVWFALVNRRDPDHRAARRALESFRGRLVTSNYVFDETVTLCLYRLGHDVALRVGDELRGGKLVDLARAGIADEAAAWDLFRRRADKQYSFTDCVSFVMMRKLGIEQAAAFDDGFRREGFTSVPRRRK